MKRLMTVVMVAVLMLAGCSAKQTAKFDRVTGKICDQARRQNELIILGYQKIPHDETKFWAGLTLRQVFQLCAERNVYFRNNPTERPADEEPPVPMADPPGDPVALPEENAFPVLIEDEDDVE